MTNSNRARPLRRGGDRIRRRDLIVLVACAAAWPVAGHSQQPEQMRRVGVLLPWPEKDPVAQASVKAFAHALTAFGWVEGKNIRIDYRFGAGDPTLYKTYAAELVGLAPDAILADVLPAVSAVREQTRTIPIVFLFVPDPVELGLVQSLAHPGGNLTGFSSYNAELMGKWVQLLKEAVPGVMRVAVIFNPDTAPFATLLNRAIEATAPSFGITLTLAPIHDDAGIEEAIAAQAREPGGGLICLPDSFNTTHRDVIIAAAVRRSLPLIGTIEFPRAGGLMSYWFDTVERHAEAASYIDHILKGANPADLPVQQPTKFPLIINLKTAETLGLKIPPSILARADEVIE